MNTSEFVSELGNRGVELWVTDTGNLGFKAPRGVLTEPVRATMRSEKPRIIAYLRSVVSDDLTTLAKKETVVRPLSANQVRVAGALDVPDDLPDIEAPEFAEPSFITQLLDSAQAHLNIGWKDTLHPDEYRLIMQAMYHAATLDALPVLPSDAPLTLRPGESVTDLSRYVRLSVARSLDIRGKLKHPRLASVARESMLDDLALIGLGLDTVAVYLAGWKSDSI